MPDLSPSHTGVVGGAAPFTYEQEWYYANLRGAGGHRNVEMSFEILGRFDPDHFAEAARCFVDRHDAVRMDLLPASTGPDGAAANAQCVRPLAPGEQVVIRQQVTATSDQQFARYASALSRRDFVTAWTAGARPFVFRLLSLSPVHHAFLATFQHLVFDGRGYDVFTREIWRDYQSIQQGRTPPAAAPSFAAAASRQRSAFSQRHLERSRESWGRRLDFAVRQSWPRPAQAAPAEDGHVSVRLTETQLAALRDASTRARCSVMQWLAASMARAVSVAAGRSEVCLWVSMDSRRSDEREVVGMFAGMAPIAVRRPTAPWEGVVGEVRAAMLEGLRYQQLTAREFTELSRQAGAEGSVRRDIRLNIRTFPGRYQGSRALDGLQVAVDAYPFKRVASAHGPALHLRCDEYADALLIDLLFDGVRARRSMAQSILHRIVQDTTTLPLSADKTSRSSR